MKTMELLRGTGRTTRMLQHALHLAATGRTVFIITANESERRRLVEQFRDAPQDASIKIVILGNPANFDWQTGRLLGAHSNAAVLVDHAAIEQQFSRVLEMLHRYDDLPVQECHGDTRFDPSKVRVPPFTPSDTHKPAPLDGAAWSFLLGLGPDFIASVRKTVNLSIHALNHYVTLGPDQGETLDTLQQQLADSCAVSDVECFATDRMRDRRSHSGWLYYVPTETDATDLVPSGPENAMARRSARYLILRGLAEVVPARGRQWLRIREGAVERAA